MDISQNSRDQSSIEKKLTEYLGPFDPDRTMESVFGDIDEWVFTLGPEKFFLNPLTREWWFFDLVHDDWVRTGYLAGTVTFVWNGKEVTIVPRENTRCPSCHAPLPPNAKFCRKCGKPVQPEQNVK